jgi:hypothetical protein
MSSATSLVVIAVLDLAVIAALTAICLVPFRIGRRPRAGTLIELRHDRLEPGRWAA